LAVRELKCGTSFQEENGMKAGCHLVRCTWTIVSPVNKIDTDGDVVTLTATVKLIMTSLKSEGTKNDVLPSLSGLSLCSS
jgi:hypothetical protein